MPVQGLGVEETALAVAASERRGGRTRVLGVSTASTSTVVPLGRLGGAAGAHLARRSRQMQGEAALGGALRQRAAPRGCRDGQRAWPALGRAPPAHLEFSAGRKPERQGKLAPDIEI